MLVPNAPLGLLTNAVQTLAGVLLPSATVFLLLLCNDRAVLGPWVNDRWLNLFTGGVIAVLVLLSIILTASVLYPDMSETAILAIFGGGVLVAAVVAAFFLLGRNSRTEPADRAGRVWMMVLRGYLVLAAGMVIGRVVQLALGQG